MMIRNGLKTFAGNFMLVWKHALYLIVAFGVTAGLFVLSSLPIVDRLRESGWVNQMYDFFELFYTNPMGIADGFSTLATNLYWVLFDNLGSAWGNYALSLFLLLIVPSYLYHVGEYVLGSLTGARMSTLYSSSYAHKMISTIGRSSLYALWKMLLTIPFIVILISLCLAYGTLANNMSGAWLLLPVFIGLVLLVLACKYVFFIGFLPESVMNTDRVTKCFARGISQYTGGYLKKVLYVWGLFLMELAGVLFVGIFTLGTGLLLAIPSVMMVNIAVSFANFFQVRKENFYCSENAIVKPL